MAEREWCFLKTEFYRIPAIMPSRGDRCPRDGSRMQAQVCEHLMIWTCSTCRYEAKDSSAASRLAFAEALQYARRMGR